MKQIYLLPASLFDAAVVDTTLLFTEKITNNDPFFQTNVDIKIHNKQSHLLSLSTPDRTYQSDTANWYESQSFNIASEPHELAILQRMESTLLRVSDIIRCCNGIKAYQVGKGKPPQTKKIVQDKPFTSDTKLDNSYLPFYDGKHIARYAILWRNNNWIKYGPWLAEPRNPSKFEGKKILIRKIVGYRLISTYIQEVSYCNTLLFILKLHDENLFSYKSILGILNSLLIGWYYRKKFQISDKDTFPQIMIRDILQFPLPKLSRENRDSLERLVDTIIEIKKCGSANIETFEREIDYIVYKLYDLTQEEIAIVEESAI